MFTLSCVVHITFTLTLSIPNSINQILGPPPIGATGMLMFARRLAKAPNYPTLIKKYVPNSTPSLCSFGGGDLACLQSSKSFKYASRLKWMIGAFL